MKNPNISLMLSMMVVVGALPLGAKANPPPECPCPMDFVTTELVAFISANLSSTDESLNGCRVEVNTNVGSGERIEDAQFALLFDLEGSGQEDGIFHSVRINSEGDIGEPDVGSCSTGVVADGDFIEEFFERFDDAVYDVCKREWLHLVNLYNAARPTNACPRAPINSFRNGEAVDFENVD